ncbi:ankyrin [Setomelanomma holmii]|uniref:Ankyrin n=1 Tax=Setomelanomma holmii TaxID=210430 RepID=A0A9P4LLG5_9PLEO|nr:ankyrin [Setomelanomma holmii]
MTKDWTAVQDEIRELSFNQKRCLEDVKALMERKYKFRASTRAYRMKLKEWGFMRHKPRRTGAKSSKGREKSQDASAVEDQDRRDLSATVEPMSVEPTFETFQEKQGGFHIVDDAEFEPFIDTLAQASTRATSIVMDMLGAVLEKDSPKLEQLILENENHINDPIGSPFETHSSRFFGHPVMNEMVIMQHSDQTLLDIACGMPCGPIIWVLLSHGAKGSRHPYGTDLALHNAIKNGRPYTVQALLLPGRSYVNGVPGTTWKPLLQGVFWNHPEVVRILLRKGANIDDAGPSPNATGSHTALQLCLARRASEYANEDTRSRCNQILRMLLEAGANIHIAPINDSTCPVSPFEVFIKPWQTAPYWAANLTTIEIDCLRLFVGKGAHLRVTFEGCPCGSPRRSSIPHQILWHSTPSIARVVIDAYLPSTSNEGAALLHEMLGSCPDAKRHPSETLRDIQVLLQSGVNPNTPDMNGVVPLRKCIEQCPAVDLVARLQMLLDGGADPEVEDSDGVQPFVLAARTFEEPLLSQVMQALVSKMSGSYTRLVNNAPRRWSAKHFPISDTQTYEQVMSSTRSNGDFKLEMLDMVPADIHDTFNRAYFTVVSRNFLDTMTRMAKARMLTPRDKDEIIWIVGMRKGIDLPDYKFDQELVVALMDPQPVLDLQPESNTMSNTINEHDTAGGDARAIEPTSDAPPRTQWQFNPNNTPPSPRATDTSTSTPDADFPIDEFMPTTTLIRWRHPDKAPKPGDLEKARNSVLQYHCKTCDDGVPLTKAEQEKHSVEHAHTSICDGTDCERRFCVLRWKSGILSSGSGGCQDHLFAGSV